MPHASRASCHAEHCDWPPVSLERGHAEWGKFVLVKKKVIPVIDLFAGPGGLSEGFHQLSDSNKIEFTTVLSVEKDPAALQTLGLRTFFRSFDGRVPREYYNYVRGEDCTREQLFDAFPKQARISEQTVHNMDLGSSRRAQHDVDRLIEERIGARKFWILIGGPPCQAYSLVGRSRMVGQNGRKHFEKDHRHFLYREYLRILEKFRPPVFVMENVKGLVTAKHNGESMFERIRSDLSSPSKALKRPGHSLTKDGSNSYLVFSLTVPADDPAHLTADDFVIQSEHHGIPQNRHRVILLGIRADLGVGPAKLLRASPEIVVSDVLSDVTPLRSKVSTNQKRYFSTFVTKTLRDASKTDAEKWRDIIQFTYPMRAYSKTKSNVDMKTRKSLNKLKWRLSTGGRFVEGDPNPKRLKAWLVDRRLRGFLNHESRGHMPSDFARYIFVAAYGHTFGESPRIQDFPKALLPNHRNVDRARVVRSSNFSDRFKVQLPDRPSSTIVSHISKDGHYFIHYDPEQCRSLTVREAARLQTFPDNYFFEGTRTEQYQQVGNAVPPYLAKQIAGIVAATLIRVMKK